MCDEGLKRYVITTGRAGKDELTIFLGTEFREHFVGGGKMNEIG